MKRLAILCCCGMAMACSDEPASEIEEESLIVLLCRIQNGPDRFTNDSYEIDLVNETVRERDMFDGDKWSDFCKSGLSENPNLKERNVSCEISIDGSQMLFKKKDQISDTERDVEVQIDRVSGEIRKLMWFSNGVNHNYYGVCKNSDERAF